MFFFWGGEGGKNLSFLVFFHGFFVMKLNKKIQCFCFFLRGDHCLC